ncbi:hypothetical protein [Microbacterium testaceum]|uniref:Uncharacterized protein n=1 Tax=Microbacterium testaceum TaxID=2033 RepID=A0A2T7WPF0_MICTE|nr:hypothetical protein [Microbacterium testaceum]PVE76107.1 hypothetical protein DC432_06640 [Microbacterium testaceum]
MNTVVEQYLRSQLESVEYRVTLGKNNVANITEQLAKATAELSEWEAEAQALRDALPTQVPTPTQGDGDQVPTDEVAPEDKEASE